MLPRTVMEWTKQHDKALLGEMTISDLFQYKKGTPERGQLWDSIAGNLNAMDYPKFKVAKRSCRDRWTLLRTKYKRRMSEEIQATGIDAEVGELDEIIEDLIGKEDAAIDSDKEGKKKAEADKKAAEEIRIKAMERFGNTRKRGGEDGEEGAKKKKRRSGSDAVEFLREKAKLEHSLAALPNCGIILTGDFNHLKTSRLQKHFKLKQLVKFPTRGNATLDLFLTNVGDHFATPEPYPPFAFSNQFS